MTQYEPIITNAYMEFHTDKYPTLSSGEVCSIDILPRYQFGIIKLEFSIIVSHPITIVMENGEIYDCVRKQWTRILKIPIIQQGPAIFHVQKCKRYDTLYASLYNSCDDKLIDNIYTLPLLVDLTTGCAILVDLTYHILTHRMFELYKVSEELSINSSINAQNGINQHVLFIKQYMTENMLEELLIYKDLLNELSYYQTDRPFIKRQKIDHVVDELMNYTL